MNDTLSTTFHQVMMSRGSLVKTVYNTQALQSAAAVSTINTPSYSAAAVMSNTAGPVAPPSPGCVPHPLPTTPGAVTPTSPLAGSPPIPAVAAEFSHTTTSSSDTKKQEIDAILKQQELLAAEVMHDIGVSSCSDEQFQVFSPVMNVDINFEVEK